MTLLYVSSGESHMPPCTPGYYSCDFRLALQEIPGMRFVAFEQASDATNYSGIFVSLECSVNPRAFSACVDRVATHHAKLPVFTYINKIFDNFHHKLATLRSLGRRSRLVIMPSPNIDMVEKSLSVPTLFLPYAANTRFLNTKHLPVKYDIGFSGGWQRMSTRYAFRRECWSNDTITRLNTFGIRVFHSGFMPLDAYENAIHQTKMWFVSSESGDHISTRIFEIMASGTTLVVCNRNLRALHAIGIVEGLHVVTFANISEYISIVRYYALHDAERDAIVLRAQQLVREYHLWKHRAFEFAKHVRLRLH